MASWAATALRGQGLYDPPALPSPPPSPPAPSTGVDAAAVRDARNTKANESHSMPHRKRGYAASEVPEGMRG